ncbi:MAG: mechanosensitive ion channel family protein [Ruminococcus sp.]|nr:mechanosensitive ion channel family protein [Ruminococcus sp.]
MYHYFSSLILTTSVEENVDVATGVQNVVETVSSEVEQTTTILSSIFQSIVSVLPSILFALAFFLVGMFFIKQLMRIVRRTLDKSNMDGIMASFICSIIKIALYVLLSVIVLSLLDVPMDSIVAVIASMGVAISLALKDSLSNLAGGFIVLFSKPLKEGDTIEVNGTVGKVESISILYTRMVTADNTTVYIPNGVISSEKIINYTTKDIRRVDLSFGIAYENDIDKAREIILDEIKSTPEAFLDPEPKVYVAAYEDSAITLQMQVWTKSENYWPIHYRLLETVKKAFDRNDISIPYPQVDIHVAPETAEIVKKNDKSS